MTFFILYIWNINPGYPNSYLQIRVRKMTLIISIVAIAFLVAFISSRQSLEKKKYEDSTYLSNLQQITSFFDAIQSLNDYTTWVQRDQIKLKYSAVGKYFKRKTNYYKKEEAVKNFQ